ncbi:serine protease inhibitor swm-1-like [Rhinoderma darwinii]|uniref:serine protease inhibitor swm-1-like n=1 Tax=Rhinoderma darwinii TaxID=43563 RepID=UPI003F6799C1
MARTSIVLLSSLSVLLMLIPVQTQGVAHDPKSCGTDKVYKKCGHACPRICNGPERMCIERCKKGCFCKEGTVDNGYGECVTKKNCELCRGNATYSACSTDCNQSCATLSKPNLCATVCSIGCRCQPGYVRLSDSKRCVLPQDCPKN